MSNTNGALWALGAVGTTALVAFACASNTVGTEGEALDPQGSTSAATTGAIANSTSGSNGGATSVTSATGTTGENTLEPSTSGAATTGPSANNTTGSEPATTSSAATSSGAGGTSNVTPVSMTTMGAGGVTSSTESSTTDAASTAAGGTSTVVDDPECEEFCDLFFEACADEVADSFYSDQLYPDHESCMAVCVTFEKGGNYGSDTLGCRRAHIVDNPDGGFHCTHASESGGGQCPTEQ